MVLDRPFQQRSRVATYRKRYGFELCQAPTLAAAGLAGLKVEYHEDKILSVDDLLLGSFQIGCLEIPKVV